MTCQQSMTQQLIAHVLCGVALVGLLLFYNTLPLWISETDFPRVAFFAFAEQMPMWFERGLFFGMLGCLLLVSVTLLPRIYLVRFVVGLFSRKLFSRQLLSCKLCSWLKSGHIFWWQRAAMLGFVLMLSLLVVGNQHRLQAWVYHFMLIALVFVFSKDLSTLKWLRVLTIGIYLHSAFSKFDVSFLETHGQQMVEAIAQLFDGTVQDCDESTRRLFAFLLPLGELLLAVGFCFHRFWRVAFVGSVVMHVGLILVLMSWGHEVPVACWNIFFIVQNRLLFVPSSVRQLSDSTNFWGRFKRWKTDWLCEIRRFPVAAGVVLLAVILPVLEPFGYFDHWPGWALYASKTERVTLFVQHSARDRLPENMRSFVGEPRADGWCQVDLSGWSLDLLSVPIYPQGRFRCGVARDIAERYSLGDDVCLLLESSADRRSGERRSEMVWGEAAIRRLNRYCFE